MARLCWLLVVGNIVVVAAALGGSLILGHSANLAAPSFESPRPELPDWPAHTPPLPIA